MYFEDLALLLGTVQSILLAVEDDRFEQNALAVLVEFLPVELENAGLHEDLLYFQNYQPLVLPSAAQAQPRRSGIRDFPANTGTESRCFVVIATGHSASRFSRALPKRNAT